MGTDFVCPECKKDVGKTALSCPGCGAVRPESGWPEHWMNKIWRERPMLGVLIAIIAIPIAGFFLFGGFAILLALVRAIL